MSDALDFVVVRLREPVPSGNDLRDVARRRGFEGLAAFLRRHPRIVTSRVVRSVRPRRILELEALAARSEHFAPLHSLTSYWHLDCSAIRDQIRGIVAELGRLREVDLAYRELPVGAPWAPLHANPERASQGYLGAAPEGVGVDPTGWNATDGSGVAFADVERSWCGGHEDLFPAAGAGSCGAMSGNVKVIAGNNLPAAGFTDRMHGASVLGIVVAQDNDVGCVGIAPGAAPVRLASSFVHTGPGQFDGMDFQVSNAITAAIAGPDRLAGGDVLLLEVRRDDPFAGLQNLPTEYVASDFTAIRLASALGIVVVEAAANGGLNLDPLAAFSSTAPASGAILVGASVAAVSNGAHAKLPASNFGSRVDCYAWGEQVRSPGASQAVANELTAYRNFSGTSAAAAIIAGVAVIVQARHKQGGAGWLSPAAMRAILRDSTFGTPCADRVNQNIGSMPDLARVLPRLGVVPDVYIRDDIGDTGSVPSAGAISLSPDVVVNPNSVGAAAAFAANSTRAENGQDNFVYVRVSNRTGNQATGAGVTAYWSQVATLITPLDWHRINDPPQAVDVPPFQRVDVPAITWDAADVPATGHYCFIVTVTHPNDPEPLPWPPPPPPSPLAFSWDQFFAYVRNNNNVTWRNFEVVNDIANPSGGQLKFLVSGAPDAARVFDLEVRMRAPRGLEVGWEMPVALVNLIGRRRFRAVRPAGAKRVLALLPARPTLRLPNVRLAKKARHVCRLDFGDVPAGRVPPRLEIRQIYRGIEVGRVTWQQRAARPSG